MKKQRVTPEEFATWLVSQQPMETLASPTLHYIKGGAKHFGISEREAERLYDKATSELLIQRQRVTFSKATAYQWGGQSSLASAVPSQIVWFEWKEEDHEH